MLVVSLCKPVTHKLKMLGGGELEHYKSMGGTTKRGDQILEFQWEGHEFLLKSSGGGDLGGKYASTLGSTLT